MTEPTTYAGRFVMYAMHAAVIVATLWFFDYVFVASLENGAARQSERSGR